MTTIKLTIFDVIFIYIFFVQHTLLIIVYCVNVLEKYLLYEKIVKFPNNKYVYLGQQQSQTKTTK